MTIIDEFTYVVPNQSKRWQLRNREQWLNYCKKKNKEVMDDPIKHRKKIEANRAYYRLKNREARVRILEFMGGKCCKCCFSDFRALQIDHVHGKGMDERRKLKSFSTYRFEKMFYEGFKSGKYQLLCANCNWIKRHENNENWRAQ